MTGRLATRSAIRRRIVELASAAPELAGVTTTFAWPGDKQSPKAVWFGDSDGRQTPESFGGIDSGDVDTWTLKGVVWVMEPSGDQEAAIDEAARIFDELNRTLTTRRRAGRPARLGDEFASVLISFGAVSGPDARIDPQGIAHAVVDFDVDLLAPLDT